MLSFLIKKRRPLFFILFILLLSFIVGSFFILEIQKTKKEIVGTSSSQPPLTRFKKSEKQINLFFVGDIMLDRGVEWAVQKYGQGDWKFPFLKISNELKEADILSGNLEGPISDKGRKVGSIYSFRANPEAIQGLKYAGFDILSVANNHIFDYSREAMEDTFLRLKEASIDYVGGGFNNKEAYSPIIKEINNKKIAFLSYTNLTPESWEAEEERSGIALADEERIKENIKDAKKRADFVVVSFHFGDEYQVTSNSSQKLLAKTAIDSGANLVIGHHPHVIQEIEQYRDGYIAYSLGNFVFDQGFSEETMKGLLWKVVIKGGRIKEVIPVEIKINQFFQPEVVDMSLP